MFKLDENTLIRINRALAWGAVAFVAIVAMEMVGYSKYSSSLSPATWEQILHQMPRTLGLSGIIALLVFAYPQGSS